MQEKLKIMITKKSEIGEQFYKKKEFCGNVGILGIGVLIIDTITNKHILLNDSNLQLNIKYYNDSNFVDINDVSTYPCSEMIDKLGNETHTELLNIYQCFGFNVTITKQLNLIDNISTISHENIDITIKSIIDNVYISLIQIEQKHLSYNKPQITIKTTNINIRKGYRTTLNTFYQNVYYKYIPISMGVSSTHPYYSGYENINSTMSLSNNEDSSYGQFTVKYYLVDEVKTINFYCQSLIVK